MNLWSRNKKRSSAAGFEKSTQKKARRRPQTFRLEEIKTPLVVFPFGGHESDSVRHLLNSLHWPNLSDIFAGNTCPLQPPAPPHIPGGGVTPLFNIDDPWGLSAGGQPVYGDWGGDVGPLPPPVVVPVDPCLPQPGDNYGNCIDPALLDFPEANQPMVGAIDTGISVNNPYFDYSKITLGRDYVDGDDNPLLEPGEGNEHGTFSLGLIAGINKKLPLWVGRAIGSGKWADSLVDFVNAANLAGKKNAIVNLSLDLTQVNPDGGVKTRYEFTPYERAALEYARQHGVMIVAAAGNDGGVMSVLGQASQEFDNIITVGSGDIKGRDSYSSYGRGLDIMADGGTTENPVFSTVGSGFGTMAGTSVATAKVTGAASLVWAANPDLSYRQVIEILEQTARDLGTPGWDKDTGFGLLNTLAAVNLAKSTKPEGHATPAILTPKTWVGEGKVTPIERAVEFKYPITYESFGGTVAPIGDPYYGVSYRRSPEYNDKWGAGIAAPSNTPLEFDAWTWGEVGQDFWYGNDDALWYRVANTDYWVPSVYIDGYPPSGPSLLPPDPSPSPSPDPSPSPSPNPSPISTFSQTVQDVGYVHDLGFLRVRSGPGTDASGYQQVDTVYPGDTLTFDGQNEGEDVYDPALGDSTTWYHLADGSGWVSGLYMGAASTPTPSPSLSPNPSPSPSPFTINEPFWSVYQQYQGLGNPIEDAQYFSGDVSYQRFDNGSIISSPNGTFALYGPIRQEYLNDGGLNGSSDHNLGAPISQIYTDDNGFQRQEFEHGHIVWDGQQTVTYDSGDGKPVTTTPDNGPQSVNGTGNIPDSVPAKQALPWGVLKDSSVKGSFVKDILDAVNRGVIRQEVGFLLMSILATESSGGDWQAGGNTGSYYLGAFQIGKDHIQKYAQLKGVDITPEQFLNDKDLQFKVAQWLYDENLKWINNLANDGFSGWTTEPDKQPLAQHFADKSTLYKSAYFWLAPNGGPDSNHVYSKDYAEAAQETAQLVRQTLNSSSNNPSTGGGSNNGGGNFNSGMYHNPEAFYTWAKTQTPITRLDGAGYPGQCVTLIARYIEEVFLSGSERTNLVAYGNGKDTASVVASKFSEYFKPIAAPAPPVRGSIMSFSGPNTDTGHVGIVTDYRQVNGQGQVKLLQSNWDAPNHNAALSTPVELVDRWFNIPYDSYLGGSSWTNPK